MNTSLEVAFIGMKASLEQMQCIGEQMAQLVSGTSVAEDMVELTAEQRTFEANAAVARAADEVVGTTIDIRV